MIWAFPAAYLRRRPACVQALVFGLCVGLFNATAATANQREVLLNSVVLLVLVAGAVTGAAVYSALRAQQRRAVDATAPVWVDLANLAVWVLSLLAAVRALFGVGGLKATAAIVSSGPNPGGLHPDSRRRQWRTPSDQPTRNGRGIAIKQQLIAFVLIRHDTR